MALLSASSLASDKRTDGTESVADAAPPALIFDASAYLDRMGVVDVGSLPNLNPGLAGLSPGASVPVQSVPLPPAVFGVASIGVGWLMVRGAKLARKRFQRRRD